MSELFRSESMVYVRLVMSEEAAYDTIKQLGTFSKAHIVDLSLRHASTTPDERVQHYKKRVASCSYYERKFATIAQLFETYRVAPPSIDTPVFPVQGRGDIIDATESFIAPLETSLVNDIGAARSNRKNLNTLLEKLYVAQVMSGRKPSSEDPRNSSLRLSPQYGTFSSTIEEKKSLLHGGDDEESQSEDEYGRSSYPAAASSSSSSSQSSSLRVPARDTFMSTITGIIPAEGPGLFERMIFRVSRGNVVTRLMPLTQPLEDPNNPGTFERKSVFSLTYVGESLGARLIKIIEHFGGTVYEVPTTTARRDAMLHQLHTGIKDARLLLTATEKQIRTTLSQLVYDASIGSSPFLNYTHALRIEKAICDTMKKCELERAGSGLLRMEAWLPEEDYPELQYFVKQAVSGKGLLSATCEKFTPEQVAPFAGSPPTYFKTNKFTEPYQGIVDTYGVPRYKEVNPGLFTIISFPFLFGVMYGDIGHGTLLTLGALYFILRENYYLKEIRYGRMDEIMGMIFGGRYMLISMGCFAVYAGFVYNDCFSVPWNLFGSHWIFPTHAKAGQPLVGVSDGGVYPFGVDPNWYHTTNELAFFNSMKMKLAVTLGVTQMTFGICLGALNDIYFRDMRALYFEFIPRLTFMLCTFGYMIFIIIYKLSIDWSKTNAAPPNLVQTMIAMFLAPGHVDADKQLYPGQAGIQLILLFLALASVPVMLLAQPLLARAEHNAIFGTKMQAHGGSTAYTRAALDEEEGKSNGGHDEEDGTDSGDSVEKEVTHVEESSAHGPDPKSPHYNFSDHAIVSGIHTIEFVLGAVSNTASYLRLWALSLAHAELSDVFWSKMIDQYGMNGPNPFATVIGFAIWGVATFAVLLAMDVLECFLHALRLHWVEFQNKFFKADGYAYKPFSYATIDVAE